MITKHLPVAIEKSDSGEYDARFVMSAATPDRVRDTIEPSAYKQVVSKVKRLIALWQHDSDKPIGTWEKLAAEGDKLTGYIKFASTNLASMVKQLIADDVPLSASIGFRGKAEPNEHGGLHFKSIELLECSIVSVPAHPRATQIAKSFGLSSVIEDAPGAAQSGTTETIQRAKAATLAANRALRT
jgi:HK97 family phage prohead protease